MLISLSQDEFGGNLTNYGKLGTELGLDLQEYKCQGCSAPIGIIYGKSSKLLLSELLLMNLLNPNY